MSKDQKKPKESFNPFPPELSKEEQEKKEIEEFRKHLRNGTAFYE